MQQPTSLSASVQVVGVPPPLDEEVLPAEVVLLDDVALVDDAVPVDDVELPLVVVPEVPMPLEVGPLEVEPLEVDVTPGLPPAPFEELTGEPFPVLLDELTANLPGAPPDPPPAPPDGSSPLPQFSEQAATSGTATMKESVWEKRMRRANATTGERASIRICPWWRGKSSRSR